jgi:hypothetical protein
MPIFRGPRENVLKLCKVYFFEKLTLIEKSLLENVVAKTDEEKKNEF